MVFSSLLFLFRFLPIVLLLYFIVPKKLRNLLLFGASLIFYAWGEPVYVVLILFSTILDYCLGRAVGHFKEIGEQKKAKLAVTGSVIVNLSLLGFFKYIDFLIGMVNTVTPLDVDLMELALPIGISFYTFQTMSYTIDVYRGQAGVQKNFIAFGAYVSMFPQLIAGPIVRYHEVAEQMEHRETSADRFSEGVLRFVAGLGKKVLIANQIGAMWDEIASMSVDELTTATAWLGILAFTLQIYFDFSGYSDMAIGMGRMFGFTFPENFRHPYEAKSITEFWRRWHITLGTWFREYVYIPLGGNKKGVCRQMVNLAIVWFLTGLWHGASWNFVIWGLYYGVLLIIEKQILKRVKLPAAIGHIYTLFFVMVGWAIFSYMDMADGAGYLMTMFGMAGAGLGNRTTMYMLLSNGVMLLAGIIGAGSFLGKLFGTKLLPDNTVRRQMAGSIFVLVVMVLSVAMLVNSSYNPFLYFRF